MSSVASKWRQFKTNLTSFYVFGKYKDKSACEMYGIEEETWQLFVRLDWILLGRYVFC